MTQPNAPTAAPVPPATAAAPPKQQARAVKDTALSLTRMNIQSPAPQVVPAPDMALPDSNMFGLRVLDKPHSFQDGRVFHVMLVARDRAGMMSSYADTAARDAAPRFGMHGTVYINGGTNQPVFPVDPESFVRQPKYLGKDKSLWARYVDLTTR